LSGGLAYWLHSVLASINEVNQHRARLVPRWATVWFNSRWWTFISLCNHPGTQPATQPSIPLGSVHEYQLRLGRQGRYGLGLPCVRVSPDTSSFSAPDRASGRVFRKSGAGFAH